MKKIIIALLFVAGGVACSKEEIRSSDFNIEGYWQVQDPRYSTNATRDLFHLFRGSNVFYRYSFPKNHDFSVLTSRPQSDSMVTFYQVIGKQLQLPSPSPSTTTIYPGHDLQREAANELVFTRFVIETISPIDGSITKSRTDTVLYTRVSDPVKIAYFDNYLKKYHN